MSTVEPLYFYWKFVKKQKNTI